MDRNFRHGLTELVVGRVLTYRCKQVQPQGPSTQPTVLVMDDEPFVRQAARRFLGGSGYACVEAGNRRCGARAAADDSGHCGNARYALARWPDGPRRVEGPARAP